MEIVFGDDPSLETRAALELGVKAEDYDQIAAGHGK